MKIFSGTPLFHRKLPVDLAEKPFIVGCRGLISLLERPRFSRVAPGTPAEPAYRIVNFSLLRQNRIMKSPTHPASGFTILELLIALVIVGILTATTLPRYQHFRKQAYDSRALTDLRTVALAEESYFLDNERYLACQNDTCANLPGITKLSPGTSLAVTTSAEGFIGESQHKQGTGRKYRWDSLGGGLVSE